ncbi:MAG: NYN domain-containing protein [Lachnospiraceae bacterium]|nr:NYN domain-containing protein [Lachnospiraceae bacterium]
MESDVKFAVLIDADNISDKYIKIIMDEIANSGIATYKRIYGDWTSPNLVSWKSVLLDNSITPMQQYSYTSGKNSTDSAMIIDAMDILYSGTVGGFCIASSDSDFTRLAARLRESGMQVIGMGESKTPKPFISACNQFKYLDLLYNNQVKKEKEELAIQKQKQQVKTTVKSGLGMKITTVKKNRKVSVPVKEETVKLPSEQEKICIVINAIIEKFSDEDGWLFSGKLGDQLSKRLPDFDVRNFGFSKLTPFISSLGEYELDKVSDANNQKQIYVRMKDKKETGESDR